MSPARLAPSAAPPHAVRFWASGSDIFAEIPAKDPASPPAVLKFPLTEGGLGKALALLCHRRTDYAGPHTIAPTMPARRDDTADLARSIMLRHGILR